MEESSQVNEYLIEVPHSPQECTAPLLTSSVYDRGSVRVAWLGCRAGTHTTWIVAELTAAEEAWSLVPALLRDTARVVPVDRYTPDFDAAGPERSSS